MATPRSLLLLAVVAFLAPAAEPGAPDETAEAALKDYARACEHDGGRLWGAPMYGPLVLVDGATRAAIANYPDPDKKFQGRDALFFGSLPKELGLANTSVDWSGARWAMVMLPVPSEPFDRIRLLVHESFHRMQPQLGLSGSDPINGHLDQEGGRVWLRLELRAMARALRTSGEAAKKSAEDAMLFRAYRYKLFPGAEKLEASLERQEGLPEYTGTVIALKETGEVVDRAARSIEDGETGTAFARGFAYSTGPGLGLLLDRYAAGWREAMRHGGTMYALLIAGLKFHPPADPARIARERAAAYGYTAIAAHEHERELRRQARMRVFTASFIDGPVLRFPRSGVSRSFNPNSLVPFGSHGTVYPTGTFGGPWGSLEVSSVGALISPDNMTVVVAAPQDVNARPLTGPGYKLELAPGWTVVPGVRKGDFEVVKAP